MITEQEIRQLLNGEIPLDRERLREIRERYPYFVLPAQASLDDNSLSDEDRKDILNRIALNLSDKESIARHLDVEGKYEDFYPEQQREENTSTDNTISTFLDLYGNNDPHEEEVLMQLIFNPTPDYAQMLAREEGNSMPDAGDEEGDEQDRLISKFIIKSKEHGGHYPSSNPEKEEETDTTPISEPDADDGSLLTESLAKSYIRQKKYSKALEIIAQLSLNYPEKSIYFADQMRFLRKVVLIEQLKKK